jgi:hypothetical protein
LVSFATRSFASAFISLMVISSNALLLLFSNDDDGGAAARVGVGGCPSWREAVDDEDSRGGPNPPVGTLGSTETLGMPRPKIERKRKMKKREK